MLEGTRVRSDPELISDVRSGNLDAYGELFARHADAARRLARQFARGSDAEDLVSEAFTKVMGVLTDGGGPDLAFRAYLLATVRRLHVDRVRKDARLTNYGDMKAFDVGAPFTDSVVAQFESGAAARAFASLPVRWQVVLWHLEVENQRPVDIAPLLGMTPNSVCALAYRAREGLRQAFLSAHLRDTTDADCRWTVEHLGAYVRTGLARRETIKVEAHLDTCRSCAAMNLELTEVNSNLRGVIAPLLLGTAAAGYLAGAGSGAGMSGFVALLARAKDALFGSSGASAGTAPGVTAGASAGAAGGTGVATAAGSSGATVAATAAGTTTLGTTAGATAATTAVAATAAGVTTGGAVAGVTAGTTATVLVGAAAASAATTVTASVGAAGLAMIAVGTVAITLGVTPSTQYVGSAPLTSVASSVTASSLDLGSGVASLETVPVQVDVAPPPAAPPADSSSSGTTPVTTSDSTAPATSSDSTAPVNSTDTTAPSGQADQPSASSDPPAPDPAPVDTSTQDSTTDTTPTDVTPAPEPDPSTTPSDSPTTDPAPTDSETTLSDGSPSPSVDSTSLDSASEPSPSPDLLSGLDDPTVEPSEAPTP